MKDNLHKRNWRGDKQYSVYNVQETIQDLFLLPCCSFCTTMCSFPYNMPPPEVPKKNSNSLRGVPRHLKFINLALKKNDKRFL